MAGQSTKSQHGYKRKPNKTYNLKQGQHKRHTNTHHITPQSRGGPRQTWNEMIKKTKTHNSWHDFTYCPELRFNEMKILCPYWLDAVKNKIYAEILGEKKTKQLRAFLYNYHLTPEELIVLFKSCYADACGNLIINKLRAKQIQAFKKNFGPRRHIDEINVIIENKYDQIICDYENKWTELICSKHLRPEEFLALLPYWFDNKNLGIRKGALTEKKLKQFKMFNNFSLRPDEVVALLKNCYTDINGHIDFFKLRPAQIKALRLNLFHGETKIDKIIAIIKEEWMTPVWTRMAGIKEIIYG